MPLVPCIRTRHCNRTLRCTKGSTRTRYPADFSNFLTFASHSSTIWIHISCASPFLGHRTNCTYPPGEKKRFLVISFVVPIGDRNSNQFKKRPPWKGNLNKEILPTPRVTICCALKFQPDSKRVDFASLCFQRPGLLSFSGLSSC